MEIIIENKTVIIDDEDFEKVNRFNWNMRSQYDRQYYFTSTKDKILIYLHRLIMDAPEGMVVDHISGDTLDNRKSNLRICTKLQNQYNQKKHKGDRHSKFKGVTSEKN